MSQLDQLRSRIDELSKRYKTASGKKASLSGQLQAKKEELVALKREIEEAGLDPKNLKETRDELYATAVEEADNFEKQLAQVEAAIAAFEKK